ncbi:MAG: hypothetical protein M1826_000032 [Phylliscum demangeonii]|nr:MAG: hypothetical protein M1826_000032 [Phylliscum demangeonii]
MASSREERFLQRQRGAGLHKIRDVDFGLAFPTPAPLPLAPRLSTASSRSQRSSLPGHASHPLDDPSAQRVTPTRALRRQQSESAIAERGRPPSASPRTERRSSEEGPQELDNSDNEIGSTLTPQELAEHAPDESRFGDRSIPTAVQGEDEEDELLDAGSNSPEGTLKRKRAFLESQNTPGPHNRRLSPHTRSSLLQASASPGLFVSPGPVEQPASADGYSGVPDPDGVDAHDDEENAVGTNDDGDELPGRDLADESGKIVEDAHWEDDAEDGDRAHSGSFKALAVAEGEEEADELAGGVEDDGDDDGADVAMDETGPDINPTQRFPKSSRPQTDRETLRPPAARKLAHKRRASPHDEEDTAANANASDPDPDPDPDPDNTSNNHHHHQTQARPSQPQRKKAPAKPRRRPPTTAASVRQKAARSLRRSKGAQVLVYRLAQTRGEAGAPDFAFADGEDQNDEDVLQTAPKFVRRPGVNAVDVLNQLCKEEIDSQLLELQQQQQAVTDRHARAVLRRQRKGVEAFGEELAERCFELTELLDTNHALHIRSRKAQAEKFALREEYLQLRRERQTLALKTEDIRQAQELRTAAAHRQLELNTTLDDIDLAIQRGRALEAANADASPGPATPSTRQPPSRSRSRPRPRSRRQMLEPDVARAAAAAADGSASGLELRLRKFAGLLAIPARPALPAAAGAGGGADAEAKADADADAAAARGAGVSPPLLAKVRAFNEFLARALAVLDPDGVGGAE